MENLNAEQIIKALENWAKNFDGKATEFVIICSARRIIDYLSKENERLYKTCEKLADTIENIEDHCKTYMKDYFKRKGKSESEVRADTVRKMQER